MRRSRITALVLVTALITAKVGITQPSDETGLQGTWEVLAIERGGSADPEAVGHRLTFHGDRVQHHTAGTAMFDTTVSLADLKPMDPARMRAMMVF